MAGRWKLFLAVCAMILLTAPLPGQVQPAPAPIPIPGGDVIPPFINQFLPGVGPGFDGLNADPHGITNFRGVVAMGYTSGTAMDTGMNMYNVNTDIRDYQGEYVGAVVGAAGTAGASKSAKAYGTFVEI